MDLLTILNIIRLFWQKVKVFNNRKIIINSILLNISVNLQPKSEFYLIICIE